jgi:hypothetical protein
VATKGELGRELVSREVAGFEDFFSDMRQAYGSANPVRKIECGPARMTIVEVDASETVRLGGQADFFH